MKLNSREFMFIQSTTEQGGAETVLLNLMGAKLTLPERSVVVSLGFGKGTLPRQLKAAGVEVLEVQAPRLRNPAGVVTTVSRLSAEAKARGIRAVIGNGTHPQVYGSLVAAAANAKSVYFVHDIYKVPLENNDAIEAMALSGHADLLLANSGTCLDSLDRLKPGTPKKLLNPGTPTIAVSAAAARDARRNLGIASDHVLFGVFGRLQRWKGQDVFLEAAVTVAEENPDARFVVVGGSVFGLEPEFREELEDMARGSILEGRITFTGFQPDIAPLLAACDVVCHTSRVPEPFGMVIIEAMAQSRAVIATRGGGPSEIIEHNVHGILVNAEDSLALSSEMLRLGRDEKQRRVLGSAAAQRVQDRFTSDIMATNMLRYLEGVA